VAPGRLAKKHTWWLLTGQTSGRHDEISLEKTVDTLNNACVPEKGERVSLFYQWVVAELVYISFSFQRGYPINVTEYLAFNCF
jgi:hypothetical protein